MATSSIFANIKITDPEKIEAFVAALDASIADPMPRSDAPRKTVLGNYTGYVYKSCDASIVLTVDDKILVISGKDEGQTKAIYDELIKRMGE